MLNHKIKSRRGKILAKRTDSLCIIEFENEKMRVFTCIIQNKEKMTIFPIICSQIASNTTMWTYYHKTYKNLKDFDLHMIRSTKNMSL